MRNFEDAFETRMPSFINFSICMSVPLSMKFGFLKKCVNFMRIVNKEISDKVSHDLQESTCSGVLYK